MTSDRFRLLIAMLTVLCITVGFGGRILKTGARPFWSDEAWVAATATQQSYAQLLRQTDVPAPPLFLVSVKALSSLASRPELGLRLFPLICGSGVLLTSFLLLQTMRLPRTIVTAAVAFASGSAMLIAFSRELKQYEVEAFFSLFLSLLVFRLRRVADPKGRRLLMLGTFLTCLTGPWFGYGFIFAAVPLMSIPALLPPLRGTRRQGVLTSAIGLSLIAASTIALMILVGLDQARNPGLRQFTSTWFIRPFENSDWVRAIVYFCVTSYAMIVPQSLTAITLSQLVFVIPIALLLWGFVAVGLWTWPRRSRAEMTVYVLSPWILLLVAAMAARYPFANSRMMVMWAAPTLLVMAAGVVRIARACSIVCLGKGGPGLVAGLLLSMLPLVHMLVRHEVHVGWVNHDFPRLLQVLRQERRPKETAVATVMASSAVAWYRGTQDDSLVLMPVTAGNCVIPEFSYENLIKDIIRTQTGRLWILTVEGRMPDASRQRLLEMLETAGYGITERLDAADRNSWGTARLLVATRGRAVF